jgi:hypothetical protein
MGIVVIFLCFLAKDSCTNVFIKVQNLAAEQQCASRVFNDALLTVWSIVM